MVISVLIVDDHSVVRQGLKSFLSSDPDLVVVGEAANGVEAIGKARHLQPDLVLLDVQLATFNGISVISTLRAELPQVEIVILADTLDKTSMTETIRSGAIGYILKDTQEAELCRAVKAAAHGQLQLSPRASTLLIKEIRNPMQPIPLTTREADVLRLLATGDSNLDIAQKLSITDDTVKSHVHHILGKLGVQSRTQAALTAVRLGLVSNTA